MNDAERELLELTSRLLDYIHKGDVESYRALSSPEKMKKGMARNENTFMPETIIWMAVSNGKPSTANVARQLSPIANATGTPSSRKITKLKQRTVSAMMELLHYR